jgi:hypothetical protein
MAGQAGLPDKLKVELRGMLLLITAIVLEVLIHST